MSDEDGVDEADSEEPADATPHSIDAESHHDFWAEAVADEVEQRVVEQRETTDEASGEERPASRDPDDPIVIKGGVSPSGVAHLGNVNEIMRGYFVAEVLRRPRGPTGLHQRRPRSAPEAPAQTR